MICLLPNCCFLSETSRMLEIYRALLARGAEVVIAAHGGPYQDLLSRAGAPYDQIGPPMSARRCHQFVGSVPGIGPPGQSMWSDEELRVYALAEASYFREHQVAVAVTGWTLTALLSTRLAGIPLVTEHAGSFIPPLYERGLLPAPSRPAGLPAERWLPGPVRRRLFNAGIARLSIYTSGFNRVAAELGVEGVPSFPALLLGDLTLVTDVPEVLGIARADVDGWTPRQPGRYRPGTTLRYTGPIYARLDLPVPDRVRSFLAGPGPAIYVAITSSTAELVRQVVAALAPVGARILVAATAHDLRDLASERVMVEPVLPSDQVMPLVDLAVTAGGQGSVQTAIAAGVPFIGIPLQPEQDANVVLAQRQGVGRLVALSAAGTPALTGTARALLTDGRARENARRLQRVFAGVDGPGAAADAVIELAAGKHAGRRGGSR
jgi:UDP:flavonoid glycosyltransferase YjiC (YdhE family)